MFRLISSVFHNRIYKTEEQPQQASSEMYWLVYAVLLQKVGKARKTDFQLQLEKNIAKCLL